MIGRPFEPGNKMGKGRPPGTRNKMTVFQELLAGNGVEIINQVKLQALKKDPDPMILRAWLSPSDGDALSRILVNQRVLFDDDAERRLRIVEQTER